MNKLILEEQSLFFNEESLSEVLNEGFAFSKEDIKRNYEATEKSYKKLIERYKTDNKKLEKFLYNIKEIYKTTNIYYKYKDYFKVIAYMNSSTVSLLKLAGITLISIAGVGLSAIGVSKMTSGIKDNNASNFLFGLATTVIGGSTTALASNSLTLDNKDIINAITAKTYSTKFIKLLQNSIKEVENYLK